MALLDAYHTTLLPPDPLRVDKVSGFGPTLAITTFYYSTNFGTKFSLTGDIITTTTGVILTKAILVFGQGKQS